MGKRIVISAEMIEAAKDVLHESGAFQVFGYEPTIGSNRLLVADMVVAALKAGGYDPQIASTRRRAKGNLRRKP